MTDTDPKGTPAMPKPLTKPQQRGLRILREDEGYGHLNYSVNWYHAQHTPGSFYVDARTARVLIDRGLAEIRFGYLYRTPAGTTYMRENR